MWFFSDVGMLVPDVAAGFLYLTNSGIAYLDCYVSNPEAKLKKIRAAIESITGYLIWIAKNEKKAEMICCNTRLRSIKRIAYRFGFECSGNHTSFSKILNVCPPLKG